MVKKDKLLKGCNDYLFHVVNNYYFCGDNDFHSNELYLCNKCKLKNNIN